MPPRASRAGARGRGRGRGRGSARAGHSGATGQVDDTESVPDISSQTQAQDSDGSDLVMQDAATRDTPIEISATPEVQPEQSSTASATQSRTSSVAPSRAGGRFRPKNVRRDATERARLEAERNRDLNTKIKEEERELRAEERRSRRGGRGRGDMSQRGFSRRTITASGPFSAVSQESGNWGPKDTDGFSSEYAASRYKPRREHENRINIDMLNGYTESGDNFKSAGHMPVGLVRTQHEEAEVKVKTTAELEAEERQSSDDEDLFLPGGAEDLQNMGGTEDSEVWHAAPKSQVKVKAEPGTEPEAMDIDMADIPEAVQPKAPPSPELKKRLVNEVNAEATQRKRNAKAAKDPEIAQTIIDLEYQLKTLSFKPPIGSDKEGEGGARRQPKDNQIMLFQLPPILPPLARPTDGTDGETDGHASRENSSGAGGVKIKTEDGAKKEEGGWTPFGTLPPEGGLIGKLNVRKSGKVEFDWGGTMLTLGAGAETEFLTTALIVEQNVDLQNPEQSTGVACGMGQILSRFVLAPVWDEEEDWDPNLDDIDLS
ncbi:RNA polymerase III RPC4-domain-containing protein [Annulohypoxylon bovei var. microspora]|nr:RNA polymerase III RPC4-domain-containing protein [Annulohypoxylon bovei var. microspora]